MPNENAATATQDNAAVDQDGAYLKAVAEVGDTRKLAVAKPIYAANGIKLLDAGATLSTRTLEVLVGHKLATPLESSVSVDGAVRVSDLIARTKSLVNDHALLSQFARLGSHPERLWTHFGSAPLPESVLFRLTVAREKFASLYDHSLRAAFVALFLGMAGRLGDRDLELLTTAALMHDFGMLYADPARFDNEGPLDTAARRQLRAHPVTGMLIARREPQLNPAIATAIVQHHERLDRSGYPAAPAPDQITRMARILMLVEIVLAMVEHRPHLPELQLSLILRANHRGFDQELAGLLLAALPRIQVEGGPAEQPHELLAKVADLLAGWEKTKPGTASKLIADVRGFVEERLAQLRRFLADAGIDVHADAPPVADDPIASAEVGGLLREALWHIRQMASETTMRWPHLTAADQQRPVDAALSEWLRGAAQLVDSTNTPA